MSDNFVKDPGDVVKVDQKVQVRVKGIDDMGRLNLSMMLDPAFDEKKEERKCNMRPMDRGRRFGGSREGYQRRERSSFDRRGQRGGERSSSGGPHFPTSRFVRENKPNR